MREEFVGTTPLGGSRSEVVWMDADGAETERELAVRAEITEFDADDLVLGRTYMDQVKVLQDWQQVTEAVDPGVTVENGDWIKEGTWDLWYIDDDGVYQHTVQTVQEWLRATGNATLPPTGQRAAIALAMNLVSWVPAPQELKDEAAEFIRVERTD